MPPSEHKPQCDASYGSESRPVLDSEVPNDERAKHAVIVVLRDRSADMLEWSEAEAVQFITDMCAKEKVSAPARDSIIAEHRADRKAYHASVHKPPKRTGKAGARPEIVTSRQLRTIRNEAWNAVVKAPFLFTHGRRLARIEGTKLEALTKDHMLNVLVDYADWVSIRQLKDGEKVSPSQPPPKLPGMMLADPDPRVREIESLITVPTLGRDGKLLYKKGYNEAQRVFLLNMPGSRGLNLPHAVSMEQAQKALKFIEQDWLGDFPFVSEADKAAALALTFLPFLRHYIDANTPLHLIEAPSEGTGKSLLWQLMSMVATDDGGIQQLTGCTGNEEEIRKAITTARMDGRWYLVLDNESGELKSGQLAKAVTLPMWSDRILGANLPFEARMTGLVWVLTGNNLDMSRELIRRTVPITLDANVPEPWTRDKFKIADIIKWTQDHRRKLIEAHLTVVQGWADAGCPEDWTARFGRCERWASVMAGFLGWLDVKDFLGNLTALHRRAHAEDTEAAEAVYTWWLTFGVDQQPCKVIAATLDAENCLQGLMGSDAVFMQQKASRLGRWLHQREGRVYRCGPDDGSVMLKIRLGSRAHNLQHYWIESVSE